MAYVSYSVAPAMPLGPRSVGAFGAVPDLPKVLASQPDVPLTPEQRELVNESIKTKLWATYAPYRAGMTDAEADQFMMCSPAVKGPTFCRNQVLAARAKEKAIPTTVLVVGGLGLLGAIYYVTKR